MIEDEIGKAISVFSKIKERLIKKEENHERRGTTCLQSSSLKMNPNVLMLDEPSWASSIIVEQIFEIIQSLIKKVWPILLVEQMPTKALQIRKQRICNPNR